MKRNIIMVLTILISFVLQTTVFQFFNFGGIAPNLLIIVTASYGFMLGRRYGMVVGFISGLLMDIFYGTYFFVHRSRKWCFPQSILSE